MDDKSRSTTTTSEPCAASAPGSAVVSGKAAVALYRLASSRQR